MTGRPVPWGPASISSSQRKPTVRQILITTSSNAFFFYKLNFFFEKMFFFKSCNIDDNTKFNVKSKRFNRQN